jgi:hypothetical protein
LLLCIPWAVFAAAAAMAILLGRRWPDRRTWLRPLLGAAIALPLLLTLRPLYPLFFVIDQPTTEDIAQAITEGLNSLAFGVVLDVVLGALFTVSRMIR